MRFLKTKIALSAQSKLDPKLDPQFAVEGNQLKQPLYTKEARKATKPRQRAIKNKARNEIKSTKTVVKNYGKAIASFAANPIAFPYLMPLAARERVDIEDFCDYIRSVKDTIEGIDTFRVLLLVKNTDPQQLASFKRIFQGIAEVFIKYFSVNWVFSGRMMDKETHLKVRFRMLRRVQNPELFTYLK